MPDQVMLTASIIYLIISTSGPECIRLSRCLGWCSPTSSKHLNLTWIPHALEELMDWVAWDWRHSEFWQEVEEMSSILSGNMGLVSSTKDPAILTTSPSSSTRTSSYHRTSITLSSIPKYTELLAIDHDASLLQISSPPPIIPRSMHRIKRRRGRARHGSKAVTPMQSPPTQVPVVTQSSLKS